MEFNKPVVEEIANDQRFHQRFVTPAKGGRLLRRGWRTLPPHARPYSHAAGMCFRPANAIPGHTSTEDLPIPTAHATALWRQEVDVVELRLGQLLIESGVLTPRQLDRIVQEQQITGEPFGLLCERLFNVDPEAVEQAWARQYASLTRTVDPMKESVEKSALELVTRRQAWQFRVLPMRFDDGELMLATTQQHLRRALRFAVGVIGMPVFLVVATPQLLGEALCRYYPLPGMTPASVDDECMDKLLGVR